MAYNTDARWNIGTITHMNDQRFKFCGFCKIPEILDTLFQFWALLQKTQRIWWRYHFNWSFYGLCERDTAFLPLSEIHDQSGFMIMNLIIHQCNSSLLIYWCLFRVAPTSALLISSKTHILDDGGRVSFLSFALL